jgi:anaerobic ribonucleoside-triphosphate reductase activating protein
MNILSTQYTLSRKSLEIYIAGCKGDVNGRCPNCHNPESWNFNNGDLYDKEYFNKIKSKVEEFDNLIQNIEIFGGEPNDQNQSELEDMLLDLKTLNKPIWLFTRYDLCSIPQFEKDICS